MAKGEAGRSQAWPALLLPLGLGALLGLAVWLFAGKLEADGEAADLAARKLEGYARLEAAEIAAAAVQAGNELVAARLAARRSQEQNLRIEAKAVLDSVSRLLVVSMEQSRKKTAARREVGTFPSGFDGVRRFLEIAPQNDDRDRAKAALEAHSPEIAALLPAGFSLVVVEDHAREMLAVGGLGGGEAMLTATVARDMIFDDGQAERRWTLRVDVASPDQNPVPTAKDVAEALDRRLGGVRPDRVTWRGWLLGGTGEVAASFPVDPQIQHPGSHPPFINAPGEWKLLDGGTLVWLERPRGKSGMDWDIAVSAMIDAPPPDPDFWTALGADHSWAATLAGLAAACLGSCLWFARGLIRDSRKGPRNESAPRTRPVSAPTLNIQPAPARQEIKPERRLVRDQEAKRAVPEVEGVIVADIEAGRVRLSAPAPSASMPAGSLTRLQAIHRGRAGAPGSRILDHAKSPLLREMAERVRPRGENETKKRKDPGLTGQPFEQDNRMAPLPSMRQGTVTGWKKVAE